MLDLGDVRESAKVIINNKSVATLWAVPFRCMIGKYLKSGINTIEIEVTNLPANRIADLDRRGKNGVSLKKSIWWIGTIIKLDMQTGNQYQVVF